MPRYDSDSAKMHELRGGTLESPAPDGMRMFQLKNEVQADFDTARLILLRRDHTEILRR